MSTGIYRVELKDLTCGFSFAEWLDDSCPHDGDIIYIAKDKFEEAVKGATRKFKKEHAAQIKSIREAIKASEYEGIDVWISW